MKISNLLAILLLLVSCSCLGQAKNQLYSTSYPSPTVQNITDALKMLNTEIFNINLPVDSMKTYKLLVYMDEYEKDMVLKHHEVEWDDRIGLNTRTGNKGTLSIVLYKKSDSTILTSISTAGGQIVFPIKKSPQYNIEHVSKLFSPQTLLPGKKIPVLLYGSMWHDPTLPAGAVRFCMERKLATDFSSEAFKNMPHYYIFSLELQAVN